MGPTGNSAVHLASQVPSEKGNTQEKPYFANMTGQKRTLVNTN